ncbi:glycosyl transferase [Kushneria pakistanensis]|uniref:Glycosyl transferase n=2 Tax=Kushneria pakistanensis TaxID=1508770 RepID=A0ABQ3FQG3_9GAMM|nr:glycosyl transferase [Kushneria pakistanensis]
MAELHVFSTASQHAKAEMPGYETDDKQLLPQKRQQWLRMMRRSITRWIPDRLYIAHRYQKHFGVRPNLVNPETFNEKICYRRLHPEPIFSPLSDKLLVRDYVRQKIGDETLLPLYPVSQPFTQHDYDRLPNSFVLKANHGSGYNLVVRNKADYSFDTMRRLSDHWLASNFYRDSRELHYRSITPRLMCEKLLLDEHGKIPKDYKFYCFRAEGQAPKVFIEVTHDRFTDFHVDYYDQDWNLVDVVDERFNTGDPIEKPAQLDRAMKLALKLSEGFGFVRVDFYLMRDAIYFGEITFTPTGGMKNFRSAAHDRAWGELFDHQPMTRDFGYEDIEGNRY